MHTIYISEEPFNQDEEYPLFESDTEVFKLYIAPFHDEDYEVQTRRILSDFLITQNVYPIHLAFEPFAGMADDLTAAFQKQQIEHSFQIERGGHGRLDICFAILNDAAAVDYALTKTFWLAGANTFYALSTCDRLYYKEMAVRGIFGREKIFYRPHFTMNHTSMLLVIWHDGQGFNLYSPEQKYSTAQQLAKRFPQGATFEFD